MQISLTTEPIPQGEGDPTRGAIVTFLGVVRGLEDGREISGIEYSSYPEMAEATLEDIAGEAVREFGEHSGQVIHRTGFVPAGEAAISIEVMHHGSAGGFDLCRWYLRRIKEEVPIWKHPVFRATPGDA